MTQEELNKLLHLVGKFVGEQVNPLKRRIEELENQQKEFRYCGVWAHGKYHKGNFVTHNGSLWHCDRDTDRVPGKSNDYTLCVKHGRDGRDDRRSAA